MDTPETRVTQWPEDDNPEQYIGEEADDNFDYDPDAEIEDGDTSP